MKRKNFWITSLAALAAASTVLGACSQAEFSYTVTVGFDINCAAVGTAPEAIYLNVGETYGELPVLTMENEGFTFAGWNTRADGTGRTITADSIVGVTSGNHTLYAVWSGKEYQVSFDLGGGNINGVTQISSRTVNYGEMYGSLAIPADPVKPMHKFKGWYTQPNGQGEKVTISSLVRSAQDHKLYAYFKPLTMNYDFSDPSQAEDFYAYTAGLQYEYVESADGNYLEVRNTSDDPKGALVLDMFMTAGTKIELEVEFVGVIDEVDFTQTSQDANALRAGFFCYGANADGSNLTNFTLGTPGAQGTPDHINKWYWGQGGRSNASWEKDFWNNGNIKYTVTIWEECHGLQMMMEFGRKNQEFDGYTDYVNDKSLWVNNCFRIKAINIDYVAPEVDLPDGEEVAVSFDWNYETDKEVPASFTGVTGSPIGELPEGHERAGCEFIGWNTKADGSGKMYDADRLLTSSKEAITLYAIWEGYDYDVSFDLCGGMYDGDDDVSSELVTFGEKYGSVLDFVPEKENATFGGWFLNPEGLGNPITSNSIVNVAENHTLYAVYIDDVTLVNDFDFSSPTHALYFTSNTGVLTYGYKADERGGYLDVANYSDAPSGEIILMKPLKAGTTIDVDMEFVGSVDYSAGVKAGAFFYGTRQDGENWDSHALGVPGADGTPDHINKWYWGQGARNDPWETAIWNGGHMRFTVTIYEDVYGIRLMMEFGKRTLEDGQIDYTKQLWENNKWRINSLTFNLAGIETQVSYDLQGGNVNGATTIATKQTLTGQTYGTLAEPKKDGFEFIGWNTKADGSGETITEDTIIKNTAAHTIYAIYKQLRNVYDFTTADQLDDFYNVNGNAAWEIVTDESGTYLKMTAATSDTKQAHFTLRNMILKAGSKVEFDVEFIGSYTSDERAGFFTYGAKENGRNITSGALGTPGAAGTPDEVNKWYWGQGYHNNDSSRYWKNGRFTIEMNILEDCYGVYVWMQFGTGSADAYWKVKQIRITRA